MTTNYWTNHALANDYHLGDSREAALIRQENAGHDVLTCGNCGSEAHYRATVGATQCIRCRSIQLWDVEPDGKYVERWHQV